MICITGPHPDIATASSLYGGVHGTWSRPFGTGAWKQVPPRLAPRLLHGLFECCEHPYTKLPRSWTQGASVTRVQVADSHGTGQPGPRAGAALWAPGGPGGRDRDTLWGEGGFLATTPASAALLFGGAVGFDDAAASALSAAVRGGT